MPFALISCRRIILETCLLHLTSVAPALILPARSSALEGGEPGVIRGGLTFLLTFYLDIVPSTANSFHVRRAWLMLFTIFLIYFSSLIMASKGRMQRSATCDTRVFLSWALTSLPCGTLLFLFCFWILLVVLLSFFAIYHLSIYPPIYIIYLCIFVVKIYNKI